MKGFWKEGGLSTNVSELHMTRLTGAVYECEGSRFELRAEYDGSICIRSDGHFVEYVTPFLFESRQHLVKRVLRRVRRLALEWKQKHVELEILKAAISIVADASAEQ